MYPALDGRLMGELSFGWPSGGRGRVVVTPGSDAELFMSPTFGVWIDYERLFQFGTAQPFFPPIPAGNFDFEVTLERFWFRRRTFHMLNLIHKLFNVFCKHFDRNEHFSPFEFSSASESIQPV